MLPWLICGALALAVLVLLVRLFLLRRFVSPLKGVFGAVGKNVFFVPRQFYIKIFCFIAVNGGTLAVIHFKSVQYQLYVILGFDVKTAVDNISA